MTSLEAPAIPLLAEALPEQRLDLIEGELFDKIGQNPAHVRAIAILNDVLLLNRGFPDLAGHPRPEDIALVVEVGDTTFRLDREVKSRLYATEEELFA